MNKIYVVGIGPGGCDQMTGIAMNALKDSDTIIGYTVYVDLVKLSLIHISEPTRPY